MNKNKFQFKLLSSMAANLVLCRLMDVNVPNDEKDKCSKEHEQIELYM